MIKEKTDFELIYHKPPLGDSYYIAKKPLTK
jgi:hypothetical protein